MEEGERVVELFARRVGREVEGFLELRDSFEVRGGIFEKSLAEVAMAFDGRIIGGGDGLGREPEQDGGYGDRTRADHL